MKLLTVVLMFVMLIISGCGSKYSDETYLRENASFVDSKDNLADFLNAAGLDEEATYDEDFFRQQLIDGKIKYVEKETRVSVMGELNSGKVVEIKFLQGRYKNNVGYTIADFIIDVGKEKELAKKQDDERRAEEVKKLEEQKKIDNERVKKEQEILGQLTSEKRLSSMQDGVQIVCTMAEGTDAYQKLIGKTNLSEGTRLKITLAGVKKEATVQQDGTFSALFERSIIPVGEQNVSISTLDKEIYTGKIDVQ